jgi:NTP pyrophosphatase (non-canonical NTP hydrolase)
MAPSYADELLSALKGACYSGILGDETRSWSEPADQTVEEMAELTVALNHFRRKRVEHAEVIEEIADVFITVLQLAAVFGEEPCARAIRRKTKRLVKLRGL